VDWIFPVGVVVKIHVTGWGFSANDKLRIIPAQSQCSDNNNNPNSATSFRTNCPGTDGTSCNTASQGLSINVNVMTSQTTGVTISQVHHEATSTRLEFSGRIIDQLQPNDMITIDYSTVRVQERDDSQMSAEQKYQAYRLSGEYQYYDDPSQTYLVSHRLSHKIGFNGVPWYQSMMIPMFFGPSPPPFSFSNSEGHWIRRNRIDTEEELKGTQDVQDLRLCWGVQDNQAAPRYFSEAGRVSFEVPPLMARATINPTTKAYDPANRIVTPFVISFSTSAGRRSYATGVTSGRTMLMIRFLDLGSDVSLSDAKLVPRFAGDTPPDGSSQPGAFPANGEPEDEILPSNMDQRTCGKIFTELWSEHSEGFPLPDGCYYGRTYRDAPEGTIEKYYREIFIKFFPRNGLRENTEYQIVMNGELMDIVHDENLIDLYAMCSPDAVCERPYMVFEKGTARATMAMEQVGSNSDPSWGTDGFLIQNLEQASGALKLSTTNILQVKLTGGAGIAAIQAQNIIRIYFWPLTLWSMGTASCDVECYPYHAQNVRCDRYGITCTPEEVTPNNGRRNIIKLQMPADMDEITQDTTHTIKITGLTLPMDGYFPTRVGVQLTTQDDTAPKYTTSTGFIWQVPAAGRTSGMLVLTDRTGYGPLPFMRESATDLTENTLYARIQLGATVWNVGATSAAQITIELPLGYTCRVDQGGVVEEHLPLFAVDVDPVDDYPDYNRGVLRDNNLDGDWDNSAGDECVYDLKDKNAAFAKQIFTVKLTVKNPVTFMSKQNPDNLWRIKLSSKGFNAALPNSIDMDLVNFIALHEETNEDPQLFSGNAAVINKLSQQVIQPTNFAVSRTVDVRVFFRSTEYVGQGGYVNVDAPDVFDFGEECVASDLPESYYAFIGDSSDRLNRLRNMDACEGSKYPAANSVYNRARTRVRGLITSEAYYGFQVRVTHPGTFDQAQCTDWYVWTQDNMGYPIDGSDSTVNFAKGQDPPMGFYDQSYGIYNSDMDSITVQISNLQPASLAQTYLGTSYTDVIFYPIEFPYQLVQTNLRITAPYGFTWRGLAYFVRTTNGTTEEFPQVQDRVNGNNQLLWLNIDLLAEVRYGFRHPIQVPDHGPVTSSNSFFIEFGYHQTSLGDRHMATIYDAQPVASLTNCGVSYATNLVGYENNFLEFTINIITQLNQESGIVISGDAQTNGFQFECPPMLVEGSAPFPEPVNGVEGIICTPDSAASQYPTITLRVGNLPLMPGLYIFEMRCRNPTTPVPNPGSWTFSTHTNIRLYPSAAAQDIDLQLTAPGFVINDEIRAASLENNLNEAQRLATRDDRPGQQNRLIFRFSLSEIPDSLGVMVLQGPRGFEFSENCMAGGDGASDAYDFTVNRDHVFGPNTGASFPPDLHDWEVEPTGCVGSGRRAEITIPPGLTRNVQYVFRITVLRNPITTPAFNKWTIDYNAETSVPFDSFIIWTFTGMSMSTVSTASSQTGPGVPRTENPVTIVFTPYKSVPAPGGLLRIVSPAGLGYEFVATNGACQVEIYATGRTDEIPLFGPDDLQCRVPNAYRLELELTGTEGFYGTEPDSAAPSQSYTLIVRVYNPPSPMDPQLWHMYTFTSPNADGSAALDESVLMGFPTNPVLNVFTVTNMDNQRNGKTKVNDVEFHVQFPNPLINGDEVVIASPLGFNLLAEQSAELDACNNFRYATSHNPLPGTGSPACSCNINPTSCTMRFEISESNTDPAYTAHTDLIFKMATDNPAATPFTSDNFWQIHHMRGTLIQSSHVYPSWVIKPQLEDVDVVLRQGPQAAGSIADIEVSFVPVTGAATASLSMEVTYPTEFDFTGATVEMPIAVDSATMGGTIILNSVELTAATRKAIRINNVRLGRGGGQTIINLITFRDLARQYRMDEKLGYTGGFRLPGRITVHGTPELRSAETEQPALYPVRSLFEPRVYQDARAEFRLSFSQPVTAAQKLIVTCQGEGRYTLRDTPAFVVIGTGLVETSVEIDSNTGSLKATLKPGRPATEIALEQDTPYTVILWVRPVEGTNNWRFDTSDEGQYPTNTNDGDTPGFSPVKNMVLDVQVQRSPPTAIIDVVLNIDDGGAVVRELLIIAPVGFTFDERAAGCGPMCTPGQALGSTNRRTATIASPTGERLTQLTGLVIRVQTPEQTPSGGPSDLTWFVEGRGQGSRTPTGWGEGTGFPVEQMLGTEPPIRRPGVRSRVGVFYAGVANLRSTQIVFTFRLEVDAGNQIYVVPPQGYLLTCSTENALKAIRLPGSQPQCVDDPLSLTLTSTFTADEYSFAVAVDVPPETPDDNTWDIIIRDQDNNVVDAAYQIVGQRIVNMGVESPTLVWSLAEARMDSVITVGFTVSTAIEVVKALLITFPTGFLLTDQLRPTDVRSLNRAFPLSSGNSWADTSLEDRLKILLDDSADTTVIQTGTYLFTFPVVVPSAIPAKNIWFLSLCSDQDCRTYLDESVEVSFPLAGFRHDESAPEALRVAVNPAERARLGVGAYGLAALFASAGALV
jgi:hypothetical protein